MSEAERTATRDNSPGWIAHLSLRAPHPPWVAAAPYHRRYSPSSLPAPRRHPSPDREATLHPWLEYHLTTGRNQSHADDHRHRLLQASYYGLMSEVDTNLGRLFAHLRELKADEHTLVIFTSDHGEQMGDHWLYGKAGFFESSYHIPMIVRVPRGRGGQRVSAFTEHVDVMPTLLQWIGASVPRQCDGESLLTFLRGEPTPSTWRTAAHWEYDFRDPAIEAALGLRMEQCNLNVVRTRQAKYVHFARLSPLLFDLERDPHELTNAIESPGYEKRYGELRSRLSAELLSWRMQHTDKTLSHVSVTREAGLQVRG